MLSLFEQAAKSQYRLSKTAIALIRHYIRRTSDEDYCKGRICAVWSQVCRTARALDLTPRSINSAERELENAGFLVRSTGGNGARCGERREGRIAWAAGINLAPLIRRFHELQDKVQAIQIQQRAVDQCRAEIRHINRSIRESEQEELHTRADEILPQGRTARIADLDRLTTIRDALADVLNALRAPSGAQKTSDGSEENCAPHIPSKSSSKICSANAPSAASELRMSPRQVVMLATNEYRELLTMFGGENWPAIVETSFHTARQIGIHQRTWRSTCSSLGREMTALCVIIIQRNMALDTTHPYHARKAAGLTRSAWIKRALMDALHKRADEIRDVPDFTAPSKAISMRFPTEEVAAMEIVAQQAGMTRSQWIKRTIRWQLWDRAGELRLIPSSTHSILRLTAQIRALGRSLNQAVKAMNAANRPESSLEVTQAAQSVIAMEERLSISITAAATELSAITAAEVHYWTSSTKRTFTTGGKNP